MEAPEKLWWSEGAVWQTNPDSKRYIEYTRTDAFIKKACEWIKEKWDNNYTMPIIIDSVIDEFKNYMKGE